MGRTSARVYWAVPTASTAAASRRMAMQRTRDTACEMALRRELHRRGLRYFIHRKPIKGVRREADLLFPRARVAVFVDGCFWHGCPQHATWPKNNAQWWKEKINRNRERDADTDSRLIEGGWKSVRVWEHETADSAASRVEAVLIRRLDTSQ